MKTVIVQQLPAGTRVRITACKRAPGTGLSYPAMTGTLQDDCVPGGWDVVDVAVDDDNVSVYSFSVARDEAGEKQDLLALAVEAVEAALFDYRQRGVGWWVEGEEFLTRARALGLPVNPAITL